MRLAFVEKVLDMMYMLNPQVKIVDDYRSKLWSHAFRITNYTLNVTPPPHIQLDPEEDFFHKQPQRLPYPSSIIRFRVLADELLRQQ